MEVLEEQELKAMKDRQNDLLNKKALALAGVAKLEEAERGATENNVERKKKALIEKEKKIKTHQHVVSRVFSMEYLKFVQRDSFQILDNLGFFIPDNESRVRSEMVPWFVDLVCEHLNSENQIAETVDQFCYGVDKKYIELNSTTVTNEMERRKLEAENTEIKRIERNERRAAKLKWKLQRRENRRLFNLTNRIMEIFVNIGQDTPDLVISDVDGCMDVERKYCGLLGGFMGEMSLVMDSLTNPKFAKHIPEFEWNERNMGDFVRNVIDNVMKPNWVLEIGLSEEMENKYKEYDPEFEFSNFGAQYINDMKDRDSRQDLINIFKHYFGSDLLRKCFLKPEPLVIKKLEPVKQEGEVEDGGEGEGEAPKEVKKEEIVEEAEKNEGEAEAEVAEPESPPFCNQLVDVIIDMILNDDGYSRRFNYMKSPVNNEGETGFYAFCKFLPDLTPPPEVEEVVEEEEKKEEQVEKE